MSDAVRGRQTPEMKEARADFRRNEKKYVRQYREAGDKEKLAMLNRLHRVSGWSTEVCASALLVGYSATFFRSSDLDPVTTDELLHAKKKPRGTSEARWRIELKRRARQRACGLPESSEDLSFAPPDDVYRRVRPRGNNSTTRGTGG